MDAIRLVCDLCQEAVGQMEWTAGAVLVRDFSAQAMDIATEYPPFDQGFQIEGLVCAPCFQHEYGEGPEGQ